MKQMIATALLLCSASAAAQAETIGMSMTTFDDNYQTVMRLQVQDHVGTLDGVDIQIEDAQNDVGRQLDQVNNFIAAGVDAIMLTLVDTSSAPALSAAAEAAGIPLVYINLKPDNLDLLPDNQAFVGSNEVESGTLGAFAACQLLRARGLSDGARGYIMIGDLAHNAALQRTKDVHDVIGMDMCSFMEIIDEQEGRWSREEGQNLMTNWLSTGEVPDFVFGNNDEMAIGAIQALSAAGVPMEDVVVVGVDATVDALQAMQAGQLDVTVLQDAAAIGIGGVDTALALARGEARPRLNYVPFTLVTPDNMADFIGRN